MQSLGMTSYSRRFRDALADRALLVRMLVDSSPGLTIAVLVLTVIAGTLPALFNVAAGHIGGAVATALGEGNRSISTLYLPLAAATLIYIVMHVGAPIREAIGAALMRRADAHLGLRVIKAVSSPRGIAHLEDPQVLDQIAQAQGVITG